MQLKYKETSVKSVDALAHFLAKLVAQRSEIQREAKSVAADLLAAERIELTEHTAQQSIRDASGWGGGNGVNPAVGNATKRWQAASDHASTLRANLAELRERVQSLSVQIDAPALAATLRDGIRMAEERYAALGLDAEAHTARASEMRARSSAAMDRARMAHTARASEMRARLVEIEMQIAVLTAEAAETAAATGKIVSPPALAQLHAEAAIARAAEGSAIRKAAQSEADRATIAVELNDMRQNLRFAIRAATAVEAEAALDPIKLVLARAAVANAETTFTVRFDTEQLVKARGSVHGE
ncbi:MAG: hypothetical protein V4712_07200 [Pseudomonadota bacterium]